MSNTLLETTVFQNKAVSATMIVDLKYHRIRIHRATLHLLGNPEYIQILINPCNNMIALLPSVEQDHLAHKIPWDSISSRQCCELYSKSLLETMNKIFFHRKSNCSYRVDGQKVSSQNLILFSLSTSYPVKPQEDSNG